MKKVPFPVVKDVASVAYEACRNWSIANGESRDPAWESAPNGARLTALDEVIFYVSYPSATAADAHDFWLEKQVAIGWTWCSDLDAEKKQSSWIAPFDQLPPDHRTMRRLFCAIVHALIEEDQTYAAIADRKCSTETAGSVAPSGVL